MKKSLPVFLRYVAVSILISGIDYSVFWASKFFLPDLYLRLLLSRGLSILVQYLLVKTKVFKSPLPTIHTLPFFIILVALNGFVVSKIILLLANYGITEIFAKIIPEVGLYFVNYYILKEWVFKTKLHRNPDNIVENL